MWIQGRVKLTAEELVRYWKEESFNAASYSQRVERTLALYDQGQAGITPREVYQERLASQRHRLEVTRSRILELDPTAVPIRD